MPKTSARKYNPDILLRMIRTFIKNSKTSTFSIEEITKLFRAEEKTVLWCLNKLISEGILTKGNNNFNKNNKVG